MRTYDATDNQADLESLSQMVGFPVVHSTIEMCNTVTGEVTRMVRGSKGEWAWIYRLPPSPADAIPTEGDYASVPFTHRHTEEERVRMISGQISAIIDGTLAVYGPGEIAVVPIGSEHLFFNAGTEDVVAIVTFTRDDIGVPYAPDAYFMTLYYWIACHLGYINEKGVVLMAPMIQATKHLTRSRTYLSQFPKAATNFAYFIVGGSLHIT